MSLNLGPAISLMKEFEGFRSKAYWDATGKVWTIGYGETVYPNGKPVRKGDVISQARALELLIDDIRIERLPQIQHLVTVPIMNNQLCALISLCYNIGMGAFKKSGLLRKLNADASDGEVANEFLKWKRSGGKVLPGLLRRRKVERELFLAHEPAVGLNLA